MKIRYNVNTCDHHEGELMIHFTKACPNNCSFCIDKTNNGVISKRTDVDKIIETVDLYKDFVSNVTISGGEPFLFIEDLKKLVDYIADNTTLKITINTAIPNTCALYENMMYDILSKCDYIFISLQHYDEKIADKIRASHSVFDKQEIYRRIVNKYGSKVIGSINILKPYFETKEEIQKVVSHYNKMGFKNIKICEMFDADSLYVDIPKTLGIRMNSPFAYGCKTELKKPQKIFPDFDGHLYIKRSCFFKTRKQKATIWDLIKISTRWMFAKKYLFGVIHEDGTIAPFWI